MKPSTSATPESVLRDTFGFQEFRPGQREIIDGVMSGRDCIGVMPTGAGKSLTYQIPARLLPGTVLVVSPLISLMKDQVDAVREFGYSAAEINSTLDPEVRRQRLEAVGNIRARAAQRIARLQQRGELAGSALLCFRSRQNHMGEARVCGRPRQIPPMRCDPPDAIQRAEAVPAEIGSNLEPA